MKDGKKRIVERIVEIEAEMFLSVPAASEPECRSRIEDMKLHRRGQFAGWSEETCSSYLEDLERAEASGKNLMTLKYARMDDLIPPLSTNPVIGRILDRFVDWQQQVISRYPNIMRGARDLNGFAAYLEGELETYSDRTLELLWADVEDCRRTGGNLSLEVYQLLAEQAGYDSIDEMEKSLQ
ncbi:MAG: DUF4125 family protein [Spirochaetales bacterium]|nr:DUF4125 family protein [Spirochaetales bacterium]